MSNRVIDRIAVQGLMNIYCNDIKKYMNFYSETNDLRFAEMAEDSASKVLKLFGYDADEATKALRANGINWKYTFDFNAEWKQYENF